MTPATVVRRDDSLTSDDSMTDFLDLHSRGDLKVMDSGISSGLSRCAQTSLVDSDSYV